MEQEISPAQACSHIWSRAPSALNGAISPDQPCYEQKERR